MSGADTFGAPAEAYDRYIGRYSRQLAEALMAFAHVKPADSAIDIGCGPGALAGLLAERLGAEKVAAVDPSDSFVTACRERLPGVEVVEAVAEDLPFEEGRFDAALAQLVVNFMKVPIEGVREMARVTRPGGDGRRLRLGLRWRDDPDPRLLGCRQRSGAGTRRGRR